MFELLHGYIETWGTGGSSFRNLYRNFLKELLDHPEIKQGPKAWNRKDFKIIEECIPIISKSARNWTKIADTLKESAEEHKDECLSYINLEALKDIAYDIHNQEEILFNKLNKLKI